MIHLNEGFLMKINLLQASLIIISFIQCSGESNSTDKPLKVEGGNIIAELSIEKREDLKNSFYNSKRFLAQINAYDKATKTELSNNIFENSENQKFVEVDEGEAKFILYSNGFESSKTTINDMFHLATQYLYYDYGNLNQFQYQREKQQHEQNIGSDSLLSLSAKMRFYQDLTLPAEDLGEFNFSEKYFSLDISALGKNQFVEISKCIGDHLVPRGFSAGTGLRVVLDIPSSLRLYINDIDLAEMFSKSDKKISINFVLRPAKINKSNEFIDVVASNYQFKAFKDQLRREYDFTNQEYIYDALSSEDLAEAWNTYLDTKIPATADPVEYGLSRTAYKRLFLFEIKGEISSIIIETKELGNIMWKSNKWFLHMSDNEFEYKMEADSIFRNIADLLDSASASENTNPTVAFQLTKKAVENIDQLMENYPETAYSKAIKRGEGLGGFISEATLRKHLIELEKSSSIEASAYSASMELMKSLAKEGNLLNKSRSESRGKTIVETLLNGELVDDAQEVLQYFQIASDPILFEYFCERGESGKALYQYNGEVTEEGDRLLLLKSYLIQGKIDSARIYESRLTQNYDRYNSPTFDLIRKILKLYEEYGYKEEIKRNIPLAKELLLIQYSSKLKYTNQYQKYYDGNRPIALPEKFDSKYTESSYNDGVMYIAALQMISEPEKAISYFSKCISRNEENDLIAKFPQSMKTIILELIALDNIDLAIELHSKYRPKRPYIEFEVTNHFVSKGDCDAAVTYLKKLSNKDNCEIMHTVAQSCAMHADMMNTIKMLTDPCIKSTAESEGRIVGYLARRLSDYGRIDDLASLVTQYKKYPDVQSMAYVFNPDSINTIHSRKPYSDSQIGSILRKMIRAGKPDLALGLIEKLNWEAEDEMWSRIVKAFCEIKNLDLAMENIDKVEDEIERFKLLVEIGVAQESEGHQLSVNSKRILKELYEDYRKI